MGAPKRNRNAAKAPAERVSHARIDVAVGELRERCVEAAQRRGVSLSEWVRDCLESACQEEEHDRVKAED